MPGKLIICPYCFERFGDEQVHFRMETAFQREEELDPEGQGRTESDLEELGDKALLERFKLRQNFLVKDDEIYERFWSNFGGTTEEASASKDGQTSVMPFHRAVFDPNNESHKRFFNGGYVSDDNSLVISAIDCFGKRTDRRVCPHCHNPLPGMYGKNPVKFISVIGITGAGKTVYLSQLCKKFKEFTGKVGIAAVPTSKGAMEFVDKNAVAMNEPLPAGSPPGKLTQPIFFDLNLKRADQLITNTVVIYDIAGENCVDTEKMKNFGHFVEHSDAIMLLIDPVQFDSEEGAAEPAAVLDTIYNNIFTMKNQQEAQRLPLAICISKGDTVAQPILNKNIDEVRFVQDSQSRFLPVFNARGYNELQCKLKTFIDENAPTLRTQLMNLYTNYNYFLFSAIGTSTTKIEKNGASYDAPAAPPIPKRIEEPLLWLFHKLNYIGRNSEIQEPEAREPETWVCVKGHKGNTGERCHTCNRDRNGKKPGLFGIFASF